MSKSNPNDVFAREVTFAYGPRRPFDIEGWPIESASGAARFARKLIGDKLQEHFIVIGLSSRHKIVGWSTVAIGTISSCTVAIRDVIRFALLSNSAAIIIAHNHPSGDCAPSETDTLLTQKVSDACRLMDVLFLDHVIVSSEDEFAYSTSPLMPK